MACLLLTEGTDLPPVPLRHSPFRIGRAADSHWRLDDPAVRERHCALFEDELGWRCVVDSRAGSTVLLNGERIEGTRRLQHGDRIALTPQWTVRFVDEALLQAEQARHRPPAPAPPTPLPRIERRPPSMARARLLRWTGALLLLLLLAGGLGWGAYYFGFRERPEDQVLNAADAELYDSLLREAYDYLERGVVLLDAGASQDALNAFAKAINVIEASRLRSHPWVKPRILALQAAVGEMYRSRRLGVPSAYAAAQARVRISLRSSVSSAEFSARVTRLQERFSTRFARTVTVTGKDHAEHVSLYGPGGAVDFRVTDLSAEQVQFVIAECRTLGLRVKDFSNDAVLREQVQRAIAAGHADRAGTGLHLHVDRFPDRRDKYTVQ